ncbi:hypothetical protein HDV00_002563 [Rhizophlyctis rosea]|nr:hypothetical protein HDV00_002563 [Rhizophlyctis rosea]
MHFLKTKRPPPPPTTRDHPSPPSSPPPPTNSSSPPTTTKTPQKHLYIVSRRPSRPTPLTTLRKTSKASSLSRPPRHQTSRTTSGSSSDTSSSSSSGPRTPTSPKTHDDGRTHKTGAYHHPALTRIDSFSSVWSEAYDLEGEREKCRVEEEAWKEGVEWVDEEFGSDEEGVGAVEDDDGKIAEEEEEEDDDPGFLDVWDDGGKLVVGRPKKGAAKPLPIVPNEELEGENVIVFDAHDEGVSSSVTTPSTPPRQSLIITTISMTDLASVEAQSPSTSEDEEDEDAEKTPTTSNPTPGSTFPLPSPPSAMLLSPGLPVTQQQPTNPSRKSILQLDDLLKQVEAFRGDSELVPALPRSTGEKDVGGESEGAVGGKKQRPVSDSYALRPPPQMGSPAARFHSDSAPPLPVTFLSVPTPAPKEGEVSPHPSSTSTSLLPPQSAHPPTRSQSTPPTFDPSPEPQTPITPQTPPSGRKTPQGPRPFSPGAESESEGGSVLTPGGGEGGGKTGHVKGTRRKALRGFVRKLKRAVG